MSLNVLITASVLGLATVGVNAIPALAGKAPAGHQFIAPGPGDVRSPCPGLNTLANHGFIPRNGKNMTIPILVAGGQQGFTMGPDFMTVIGAAGILSSPNPDGLMFDLDNLDEHNFPIEHDVSLSRQDHYFGQWYNLDKPSYNQWISGFGNAKSTSIQSAARAKYGRYNDSVTRNPQLVYGPRAFTFSYGETALYLQTLSQSTTSGVVPLSWVKTFFLEERLPYEQGFKTGNPLTSEITFETLGNMVVELFAASPEPFPEGMEVLNPGTYKEIFADLPIIGGIFENITKGLLP